jgi:sterol desaturase/sphingolipid hydroxylase (fatty acid hydroxylase superfamily)
MTTALWDWLRSVTPLPVKQYYWAAGEYYSSPWFWAALAAILVAERIWPVMPRRGLVTPAMVEDSLWLNIELAVRAALLPFTAGILSMAWERTTGGFSVPLLAGLPLAGRIAVSLIIWDLIDYGHHWIRHRIEPLWHFHAIHHSQREMNLFTSSRGHVLEYLIYQPLVFVPMFALQLTPFEVMGTGLAIGWYTRLSHANVRTNFGPLGLLFVSPQHHRIHHSIEPAHQDKNFGLLLTVWDRLFGTFWPERTVYPATGVSGLAFEPPATANPIAWAGSIARQLAYPFAAQWRRPPSRHAEGVGPLKSRVDRS